ncbi:Oidioi.mRNA.OKI2018_I69.chr2.g7713.t1.cds [Oikopleura dioica]|uniref:Oidioi.mRNA.OKI2018_I69.chr2.g7713.t1.cds n=1 Tax=Oikopleura dioica TaxID=34765 RepID=A0ABN7TDG9_OIKDI|nr:Oidioi.mRNA.OKI2018_I69.chr2.g7713.t1.cds [Oikopleura dioica]
MNGEQILNLGLAGVSCSAAQTCVHPFETAMVFQQRAKSSSVRPFPVVMAELYKTEGFSGWYRGITASLARESIYSSLRFGLYEPFRDGFGAIIDKDSNLQRILSRMAAGCSAGGLAAVVACPTELLKVRAQGYVGKPPQFHRLIVEVGGTPFKLRNFYEGVSTTVVRAMSIGITKMAVYNEVKDFLKRTPSSDESSRKSSTWQSFVPFLHSWKDSDFTKYGHKEAPTNPERLGLIFCTSIITGFAITCSSSPFTNARTMIMTNPGKFSGMPAALVYIVRNNGYLGLFRGFSAQWARFGPYALIQFFCWEQLRYFFGMKPI